MCWVLAHLMKQIAGFTAEIPSSNEMKVFPKDAFYLQTSSATIFALLSRGEVKNSDIYLQEYEALARSTRRSIP